MLRIISLLIFKINGWKVVDSFNYPKKCIVIAAPHTSNWDFLIGRCYGYIQSISPKYLIKSEIFYPILGYLLKLNGGIPVYRKEKNNVVQQIVDLFNSSEELILGIAPEGTRSKVNKWKTGFYHIALKANVPILLCKLDYKNKQVGIFKKINSSSNYEKDMKFIEDAFRDIKGKIPEYYNPDIF